METHSWMGCLRDRTEDGRSVAALGEGAQAETGKGHEVSGHLSGRRQLGLYRQEDGACVIPMKPKGSLSARRQW